MNRPVNMLASLASRRHQPAPVRKVLAIAVAAATEEETGDLLLRVEDVAIHPYKPVIYQESADGAREQIAGRYVLRGAREVGFEVGEYDRRRPLIIDPVISYSTYLGDNNNDLANDITAQ